MPVHQEQDAHGQYYQYGKVGAKYYYRAGNERMRKIAKKRAQQQEEAWLSCRR
jgi:hypothetical protein